MPESPREPADETSPRLKLIPAQIPAEPDDEPMGGDPPCWAHLFEDEDESAR